MTAHVENRAIPAATSESWRAWMMTGARTTAISRQRMRGAHSGLKKILAEGLSNGNGHGWDDFSDAMVRHEVDDAIRSLPPEETQVLKLAYFGGYSNRDIASEIGVREWTVKRRLSRALHAISEHLEHGRALGRRAVYAILLFLSGRWLGDVAQNTWQAAAVAGVTVVIVTGQPASPPMTSGAPPESHPVSARSAPTTTVPSEHVTLAPKAPSRVPTLQVPALDTPVPVAVPPLTPVLQKIEKLL